MKVDRLIQPDIKHAGILDKNVPVNFCLKNKISVHHVNADHIDVVKLEFVFKAGIWHQKKPLVAMFTAQLLKEGSAAYSSSEIAENLDFYGAYLQCQHSHHYSYVTLFSLKKCLKDLLPLMESIIKQPVFDENELKIAVFNKKQEFILESGKVKTLAVREFNKTMFGKKHPYANLLIEKDFDGLSRADLQDFHSEFFHAANCNIFFTGKLDSEAIQLLEDHFGDDWGKGLNKTINRERAAIPEERRVFVPKENAIQSGLRLGRNCILKDHPDFHGITILTTILGGYFGSRLMKNIREEKGYTYGIGANLLANKYQSVLTIQSEMATENTMPTLKEVFKEFESLRSELIPEAELEMVRNYLLGELARSFDGPFSKAESHLMLWMFDLDMDHVNSYTHTINSITPKDLQALAKTWYDEKDWTVVVAGNPSLKDDFLNKTEA